MFCHRNNTAQTEAGVRLASSPFFVVGSPRSGTTLLRDILNGLGNVHIPEETGFIPFLVRNARSPLSLAHTERLLIRIGRLNRRWRRRRPGQL